MLLSLATWLQALSPDFGFFRVFQYLTFRAVMAAQPPSSKRSEVISSSHRARATVFGSAKQYPPSATTVWCAQRHGGAG